MIQYFDEVIHLIKITRKLDFVAIGVFILLAVALLFVFVIGGGNTQGARIIILSEGERIYNLSLTEMEGQSHEVVTERGVNVISVNNGRVSMSRATCHTGECVTWPDLTNTFQRIVCLPNRIVVMLEAVEDDERDGLNIDIMITL